MRNVVLVMAMFFVGVGAGMSSCQGAAPCGGFCKLQCQVAVKCSDGKNPTGSKLDACISACTDSVQKQGATSDKDCECCTSGGSLPDGGTRTCPAGSKSCDQEPVSIWAKTYSC